MNPLYQMTKNGCMPYDLLSAMQKFIRRSMEREALWCFLELESAGLYYVAANRLTVCVYEDVGIANTPLLDSIAVHVEQMNKWYKAKNGAWRLVLSNIILRACRGEKTRISDHFVCAIGAQRHLGWKVNLEDYGEFVFDMHTTKGKQMGRGLDHFFEEGMKIVESQETTDYAEDEYRLLKDSGEEDIWTDCDDSERNKLF